jgi:nucleotide-binding universal stress UspA family protein
MSYRKILAPLVGASNDRATLAAAMHMARKHGSHVEALFVRFDPIRSIPYGYAAGDMSGHASAYAIEAALRAAEAAQKAARSTFDEAVAQADVELTRRPGLRHTPTADMRVVQGMFVEEVEQASRLADLVVFGVAPGAQAREDARDGVEAALLGGARPVLLVPHDRATEFGNDVAIAFDGSMTAAHAATAAVPLLAGAKSVHALEVTEATGRADELVALRDYLALHGIEVREHVIDPAGQPIATAITQAVSASNCDMLVLGGYGHGRLREFLLGGVTRSLLRHQAPFALFLTH